MIWFLCASTVLLAAALVAEAFAGRHARRLLELAAVLVAVLPALRWFWGQAGLMMWRAEEVFSWDGLARFDTSANGNWPLLVWLAGAGLGLLWLGLMLRAVERWRRASAEPPRHDVLRIARVLGVAPARVARHFRLSSQNHGPALLPTVPGRIILPSGWSHWPSRLQAAALRHEWHHLRHGDALWNLALHLFTAALWWHPLAWVLRRRWREESERLADLAAIAGSDPADYASDLLALATSGTAPAPGVAAGFAARRTRGHLRRRVALLLRGDGGGARRSAWWLPGGALILILAALLCAAVFRDQEKNSRLQEEVRLRLTADAFPADARE